MQAVLTQLGDISTEEFLANYWQKKPLLIRNAIPNFESPLSPDELAGLALEDEVESRIVQEHHENGPWNLRSGPFAEEDFQSLPESHWTLLVQAVDLWVEEFGPLLDRFRFIPNWRIDDIMASYAPDQGSVGPHFDYYDVFLLQGQGQRRWKVGQKCDAATPVRSDCDLSILSHFEAEEEWVLNPGDMLYIPPQIAHHGVAIGDCITYSIGFRAPSEGDILSELAHDISANSKDHIRYSDPHLALQDSPGEIDSTVITTLQDIVRRNLSDPSAITSWFGRYMTQRKYPELEICESFQSVEPETLRQELSEDTCLCKHPASRIAWHENTDGSIGLFVDGEAHDCSRAFAIAVSSAPVLDTKSLMSFDDKDWRVLCKLFGQGSFHLGEV